MPGLRLNHLAILTLAIALSAGCRVVNPKNSGPERYVPAQNALSRTVPIPPQELPRELQKTTLPEYVIEPPDILLIDAIRVVPRAPYHIQTLDILSIDVAGALPDRPIQGSYIVEPGGTINLGIPYGIVRVEGLALSDVTETIKRHLLEQLREPDVSVSLAQSAATQQIAGEHLVGPDGQVTLGSYGKVYVAGMTQAQARAAIETHLLRFLDAPQVAVDVFAYNSKVYYIVTQGAGLGDGVVRFPITGNETVLDAISQINGLEATSSTRIWVARPAPYGAACDQILPVDWQAITQRANTATNFQLLPGDRVYVEQDHLTAIDTAIAKIISPMERVFGFTSLGTNTVSGLRFFKQQGIRGTNGGF